MPYIQVDDGVQIYYEERGTGNNYIFSSRSRIEHASSYTAALAALGYHVIEIQLRGYGKSTHVTEDYGMKWYDIWASDVVKAAKAMGVEKFVYTGVS
ncbi:MAG: alpha/beta hydrolase, partial [Clostridiaceae bacterium]|nr:alpha/beta hydrolase [Clostridiaceae bacterium]